VAARAGEVVAGEAAGRVGDLGADQRIGLGQELPAVVAGRQVGRRAGERGRGDDEEEGDCDAGRGSEQGETFRLPDAALDCR